MQYYNGFNFSALLLMGFVQNIVKILSSCWITITYIFYKCRIYKYMKKNIDFRLKFDFESATNNENILSIYQRYISIFVICGKGASIGNFIHGPGMFLPAKIHSFIRNLAITKLFFL